MTEQSDYLVVGGGAWTEKLIGGQLSLPSLTVTQEQPVHFAAKILEADWEPFGHLPEPGSVGASHSCGDIYGLATPGEGIKVGFHGVGPQVDPDQRDFQP